MTKARENSDYTGLAADIVAGDTAARAGRKNLIINGSMQISQRGDYTSATTLSNTYFLDRHFAEKAVVTATVQHTDVTINGVNKQAMRIAATSTATGYIGSRQPIEFINLRVGETYTFSCWVRSNNPNTRFRHNNMGGGSADSPAFTNDGNWEKVSWTVDSTSTVTTVHIYVLAYNGANVAVTTGDYIEFTELQLELGSVATDFEHRSYGEELALCQRFYYSNITNGNNRIQIDQYVYAGIYPVLNLTHPVTMRVDPTITKIGVWSGGNITPSTTSFVANTTSLRLQVDASATGRGYLYPPDGEGFSCDAEL